MEASLLLWIPYLVSATIATLQTWGAIAWFEPRWLVTLQVSVIAPVAYVVSLVVKKPIVTAALNAIVAAAIFLLTRSAGRYSTRSIPSPRRAITALLYRIWCCSRCVRCSPASTRPPLLASTA
jgi:hypothetical protein